MSLCEIVAVASVTFLYVCAFFPICMYWRARQSGKWRVKTRQGMTTVTVTGLCVYMHVIILDDNSQVHDVMVSFNDETCALSKPDIPLNMYVCM